MVISKHIVRLRVAISSGSMERHLEQVRGRER